MKTTKRRKIRKMARKMAKKMQRKTIRKRRSEQNKGEKYRNELNKDIVQHRSNSSTYIDEHK